MELWSWLLCFRLLPKGNTLFLQFYDLLPSRMHIQNSCTSLMFLIYSWCLNYAVHCHISLCHKPPLKFFADMAMANSIGIAVSVSSYQKIKIEKRLLACCRLLTSTAQNPRPPCLSPSSWSGCCSWLGQDDLGRLGGVFRNRRIFKQISQEIET